MEFSKGHGTENDFVILPDPDVDLALPAHRVAALCDRRRGLGADGLLRVARAGALAAVGVLPELPEGVGADDWFMDYRNGDGSIAEMCGNGVRVFAHYLRATGLELRDEFVVGSRAGARPVHVHSADHVHGDVTVDMGRVRELGTSTATVGGRVLEGIGIDVGNPHLACVDPDLTPASLASLDLTAAPGFDPGFFPEGVNIEILTALVDGAVQMRVHERGVGRPGPAAPARSRPRWPRCARTVTPTARSRCGSPVVASRFRSTVAAPHCAVRRCWSPPVGSTTAGGPSWDDRRRARGAGAGPKSACTALALRGTMKVYDENTSHPLPVGGRHRRAHGLRRG